MVKQFKVIVDSTEKTRVDKACWVGAPPWAGKYVRTREF